MKDYKKDKVDRRRFLHQTSQAIAGGTVLSSIMACGSVEEEETSAITKPAKTDNTPVEETLLETERPSDIFVQIKPSLKKKGGSQQVKEPKVLTQLSIKDADDYVLLIREDNETVTARNMKYTHEGCILKFQKKTLNCPCHQSVFNLDGSVKEGRGNAKKPLRTFETQIQGNRLFFV